MWFARRDCAPPHPTSATPHAAMATAMNTRRRLNIAARKRSLRSHNFAASAPARASRALTSSAPPPPPLLLGGLTVTATDLAAFTPWPVQVSVNVVLAVIAALVADPVVGCDPLQPP